jgi:hypothetical protein
MLELKFSTFFLEPNFTKARRRMKYLKLFEGFWYYPGKIGGPNEIILFALSTDNELVVNYLRDEENELKLNEKVWTGERIHSTILLFLILIIIQYFHYFRMCIQDYQSISSHSVQTTWFHSESDSRSKRTPRKPHQRTKFNSWNPICQPRFDSFHYDPNHIRTR